MKGKLIVIEGSDSSGKHTQGTMLVDALNKKGKAILLSFPTYDSPTGKIIAGSLLGKEGYGPCLFPEGSSNIDPHIACLYYAADRKYNIHKVEKYLQDGYDVVLDRYISSNMAHQGGKILDKDERFNMFQWIDRLEYWLLSLPKADQTIFLHMPYQQSLELAKKKEYIDQVDDDVTYLKNSERAYIELSELYHWDRIECTNEDGKLKSRDEIHQEILSLLNQKD